MERLQLQVAVIIFLIAIAFFVWPPTMGEPLAPYRLPESVASGRSRTSSSLSRVKPQVVPPKLNLGDHSSYGMSGSSESGLPRQSHSIQKNALAGLPALDLPTSTEYLVPDRLDDGLFRESEGEARQDGAGKTVLDNGVSDNELTGEAENRSGVLVGKLKSSTGLARQPDTPIVEPLPSQRPSVEMGDNRKGEPESTAASGEYQIAKRLEPPPHVSTSTPPRLSSGTPSMQKNLVRPAVARAVIEKVDYAASLARRGAISTAENDLHQALLLIAESADHATGNIQASRSLRNGWAALREAADFSRDSAPVLAVAASHQTPVLREATERDATKTPSTRSDAQMMYLDYAEGELARAVTGQRLAAYPFRTLGKVYLSANEFDPQNGPGSIAKAMIMFRLALQVDPRDSVSANQLGLLYAKLNYFAEARNLLIHSLRIRDTAETWSDLARVHQALGEHQLAQLANNEASVRARQEDSHLVQWVSPNQFQQIQSMVDPPLLTPPSNPMTERVAGQPIRRPR